MNKRRWLIKFEDQEVSELGHEQRNGAMVCIIQELFCILEHCCLMQVTLYLEHLNSSVHILYAELLMFQIDVVMSDLCAYSMLN